MSYPFNTLSLSFFTPPLFLTLLGDGQVKLLPAYTSSSTLPFNARFPCNPGAVLRPGDLGHSFGLQAKFFAISYVNFYEFIL